MQKCVDLDPDSFVDVICPCCRQVLAYPLFVMFDSNTCCPHCGGNQGFGGSLERLAKEINVDVVSLRTLKQMLSETE